MVATTNLVGTKSAVMRMYNDFTTLPHKRIELGSPDSLRFNLVVAPDSPRFNLVVPTTYHHFNLVVATTYLMGTKSTVMSMYNDFTALPHKRIELGSPTCLSVTSKRPAVVKNGSKISRKCALESSHIGHSNPLRSKYTANFRHY